MASQQPRVEGSGAPFVSVAIPTHNRADKLAVCVASLLAQSYPKDRYEVIVVDDGSTDDTASTMEALQTRSAGEPALRYFRLPHAGVNVARNVAFANAVGDPICLVDDDEDVPPTWLAALVGGTQRNPRSGCLGGPVRLRPEGRLPRMCGKEPLGEGELDLGDEEREVERVWSGNMALRRFALEQVGGFNEELRRLGGTEVEWEQRLQDHGGHVVYVPDAWLWHRRTEAELRLRRLVPRRFWRGRGQALNGAQSGVPFRVRSLLRDMRIGVVHLTRRRCSVGLLRFALSSGRLLGVVEAKCRRLGPPPLEGKGVARLGWRARTSVVVREHAARWRTAAANRLLRPKYSCPCCGWEGARFDSYIQPSRRLSVTNEECPRCHSHSRHRAFSLWLRGEYDLAQRRGVALVLAPEPCLQPMFVAAEGLTIHGIDWHPKPGVALRADLRNLPVRDRVADLVWCHHVLEHIEDDHAAIAELARVLKDAGLKDAGGELVVSVPTVPGPTLEYGFANHHDNGHWRLYGDDFVGRLTSAGLVVEPVQLELDPVLARRHRIHPMTFYRCRPAQGGSEVPGP